MKREIDFWNQHYKNFKLDKSSQFALFIAKLIESTEIIIELGCGNGRDSHCLASISTNYIGIDFSESAIQTAESRFSKNDLFGDNIKFEVNDYLKFLSYIPRSSGSEILVYSRFSLHSISESEEDKLLHEFSKLASGSRIALEVRTIRDPWFGVGQEVNRNAFVSDHFRRFIVPSELINKFEAFSKIECISYGNNLARHNSENPHVLRIIARI